MTLHNAEDFTDRQGYQMTAIDQLRNILNRDELIIAPGAYDA